MTNERREKGMLKQLAALARPQQGFQQMLNEFEVDSM